MAFNWLKKNKKTGTRSNIAELRSPYLKKTLPSRAKFFKKGKKTSLLLQPPARLTSSGSGHKIIYLFLFFIALCGITWVVFFSHWFDLKTWEAEDEGTLISMDDPVNKILALEKNKNLLFIDDTLITRRIIALHPEISKISVKKIFPKKIKVEFENYPLIANITNVNSGFEKKFLINTKGFLAEENTENPELPYIKIATNEPLKIKTYPIPQDKLNYILKAISLFEEKFGMKITNAIYLVRERETHLTTEKKFDVWIDMEKSLEPQMDKLKKVLPKLDIYHILLEYIDLRISGTDNEKVIFKRRK